MDPDGVSLFLQTESSHPLRLLKSCYCSADGPGWLLVNRWQFTQTKQIGQPPKGLCQETVTYFNSLSSFLHRTKAWLSFPLFKPSRLKSKITLTLECQSGRQREKVKQPSASCRKQKDEKFHQPICTLAYLIRASWSIICGVIKSLYCGFFFSLSVCLSIASPLFDANQVGQERGRQAYSILMCFRTNAL